ncbi:MAG: hypothetical protein ACOWW1_09680 [archaeon]
MKFSRLMMFVTCFCLFWSLCSGVVFGFDTNDGAVTVTFSDETPAQGSNIVINVLFTNLCSKQIEVYYFGLHFDWMESARFVGPDLSEDPVTIPAGGSYTFSTIVVEIPSDVSVGSHSYFVGMDAFEEGQSESFSWDSPSEVIVIQDLWQDTYNDLLDEVAHNILVAENVTYKSPEAQSYLEQAQNSYSAALDHATQQNWEDAISALQSASMYLEQAQTEEQNYIEPEPEQDLTLMIVGVSVAAVAIIVILLVLLRRKPKK